MAPAKSRKRSAPKPSPNKKPQKRRIIEHVITESDKDDGPAVRQIVVLKKWNDLKRFEATEDCFILDFDPDEVSVDFSKHQNKDDDDDVEIVSEKGQVACRDYPHPRNLCLKFPFHNSMHESYCKLCYCYVCDKPAPCKNWMFARPGIGRCHASDREQVWKLKREVLRNLPR